LRQIEMYSTQNGNRLVHGYFRPCLEWNLGKQTPKSID
jgi:hypothetical protein